MRIFTHRLIGLFMLVAVLALVSAPIVSFDALGQESADPGTTVAIEAEATEPTATSIPDVIPPEPPPATEQPPEQAVPTEVVVEPTTDVAAPTLIANSPSPTNAPAPTETTTNIPASATATDIPVQAADISISADLTPAQCGNSWRFSITGLTAATAPATIAVIFANAGPVQIPLFFNEITGVAFYNRSSGLDDTAISASALVPDDFAGVFQLDIKGCLAAATATSTATPPSQFIDADMTTGVCGTAWSFQITGIEPPVSAPDSITVFEGGADFAMDLQQPQTGTVATYTRADLNAFTLDRATARISSAWTGSFVLATFPCADFTPSPTATGTPASQFIDANPDGAVCGTGWRFEITGIEPPVVAPASIALDTSNGDFAVDLASIVGTTAFYERDDLPPDFTFVSATARISSSWDGEFNLLTFPCTETPTATASATATTGATETIFAVIDFETCEGSDGTWTFIIANAVGADKNPDEIQVDFDNGDSLTVPAGATSTDGGVFTSFYFFFREPDPNDVLESATAIVDAAVDYDFRLSQGPPCPDEATATPTQTGTPPTSTATATATASTTPTATLTTDQEIIGAIIDLNACEGSDDLWTFVLRNSVSLDENPESITVNFSGQSGVIVPLGATSTDNGLFSSFYFWNQNLDDDLLSASAVVNVLVDYDFVLLSGPPCPDEPTNTPTQTSTAVDTETPTATASSTATGTPTQTTTATVTKTPSQTTSPTATGSSSPTPSTTPSPSPTPSSTMTNTATPTASATATNSPTATKTATATITPTHRNDPTVWPSHTPGPRTSPTPPVGGLPDTGAGAGGRSGYTLLLTVTAAIMGIGLATRRRSRSG